MFVHYRLQARHLRQSVGRVVSAAACLLSCLCLAAPGRAQVQALGDGLSAIYFDNAAIGGGGQKDFTGVHISRVEPNMNLDWGNGSPGPQIGSDTFTARFSGRVEAPATGNYVFGLDRDNGARLWIDDKMVIDSWTNTFNVTDYTAPISLVAGKKYHVVIEYFENVGLAHLNFLWQTPGTSTFATVPQPYLYSDDRRFPVNAGVLDVTQPFTGVNGITFHATGNGITDDTTALQQALLVVSAQFSVPANGDKRAVYLPNGTYRITRPISLTNFAAYPASKPDANPGNVAQFITIQGQNRDNTVLRLDDNRTGSFDIGPTGVPARESFQTGTSSAPVLSFWDPAAVRAFIQKFNAGSYLSDHADSAIHNQVLDLTIDTGVGNPNATGLRYVGNNGGTVENVTIRSQVSSDGVRHGVAGLELAPNPGPALIDRILVEGFDTGIQCPQGPYSMPFEHITLKDQNRGGVAVDSLSLQFRDLQSRQSRIGVPALLLDGFTPLALVDSKLTTSASGGTGPAIHVGNRTGNYQSASQLFLRAVRTDGYTSPVVYDNLSLYPDAGPSGPAITEYASSVSRPFDGTNGVTADATTSLNLAVKETPDIPWGNPASPTDWVRVNVPTNGDITAALQQAVDNNPNATTIYIPFTAGGVTLNGPVTVYGNIRRVLFMDNFINGNPRLRFGDAALNKKLTCPAVALERFMNFPLDVSIGDTATVVVRHGGFQNGSGVAGSTLFLEDIGAGFLHFLPGQQVYARQLNPEPTVNPNDPNPAPAVLDVDGATFWCLGLKFERWDRRLWVHNAARAEALGGAFGNAYSDNLGAFAVEDTADMTIAGIQHIVGDQVYQSIYVQETRAGITIKTGRGGKSDTGAGTTWAGNGNNIVLYLGNRTANLPSNTVYSFNDLSTAGQAINGVHGGIDFGTNKWFGGDNYYGMIACGYFNNNVSTNSFTLPAGMVLKSLQVGGGGAYTYTISDGVNASVSGTIVANTTQTVTTNWTNPGATVTITTSGNWDLTIDNVRYGY